jgi:pimeloyl-ACP methyl ester carboxylesterase
MERAHFAASMLADVAGLALAHPERIESLTLVCPPRLDGSLRALGTRLQIVSGDQGRPASMVREAANSLPDARVIWLPAYFSPPWADPIADFTTHVENALFNVITEEPPRNDNKAEQNSEGHNCRY